MRTVFCLTFFLLISVPALVAGDRNMKDSICFQKYIETFKNQSNKPIGELLVSTALFFEGNPYVASTLEANNDHEKLVVNFREFDCNTFVETCMALVLTLKAENRTFSEYKLILQKIRYRGGYIDGYASRLHYVSDWKFDNKKKGILIDLTPSIGGVQLNKTIDFMSKHSNLYTSLQKDPFLIEQLRSVENEITNRHDYFVIDKKELDKLDGKIENGDIIAFATSVDGLDYSHIAIAHYSSLGLSFIHASTRSMSVIQEPQSLYNYCIKSKKCTGVSIFRLNNLLQ